MMIRISFVWIVLGNKTQRLPSRVLSASTVSGFLSEGSARGLHSFRRGKPLHPNWERGACLSSWLTSDRGSPFFLVLLPDQNALAPAAEACSGVSSEMRMWVLLPAGKWNLKVPLWALLKQWQSILGAAQGDDSCSGQASVRNRSKRPQTLQDWQQIPVMWQREETPAVISLLSLLISITSWQGHGVSPTPFTSLCRHRCQTIWPSWVQRHSLWTILPHGSASSLKKPMIAV